MVAFLFAFGEAGCTNANAPHALHTHTRMRTRHAFKVQFSRLVSLRFLHWKARARHGSVPKVQHILSGRLGSSAKVETCAVDQPSQTLAGENHSVE